MYFIEKLIRLYLKIKKTKNPVIIHSEEDNAELEDVLTCKHNFMPLDSTGNVLACSKCGYVVSKKRLEKNQKK